ncbi:MAG: hypothetical protein EPO02_11585 [Nitrospirae bacterium]|nr:MAG: hypothetical protein EPO02_11585 [Nitrospirota bacterium]
MIQAHGGYASTPNSIGGGSGGAILLHGVSVMFGGIVDAGGGDGMTGAGGGGGGRVAIQAMINPDTSTISVRGGQGGNGGYAGVGVISFARPVLAPTNLDCGSIPVGSGVTVSMIIQNTGDAGSFINGQFPAASAPFARVGTGIFSGLKQNAYTACPYTFHPTAIGPFSQNLMFLSNAGPVSVTISGTGVSVCRADFNADGLFDGQDIPAFVTGLLNGTCP